MATTRYGDITRAEAVRLSAKMLANADNYSVLSKMGRTNPQPRNSSDKVEMKRVKRLQPATTPVIEGVTPTAQRLEYERISAVLKQYGLPIELTDKVYDLAEEDAFRDAAEEAGKQAGSTIEQVLYGVLKAGTNVLYANGTARNQVNTVLTLNKQRAVTRALQAQKAMPITKILEPGPMYNTMPIEGGYVAVAHTNLGSDIRNLTGFIPTAQYGSRRTVSPHEIGSVEDVRYVLSPELDPWFDAGGAHGGTVLTKSGTSADVYPILYLAEDCFEQVPLRGMNGITPMVVLPKPSSSDPMGQRGYVSWKAWYTAIITNDLWMARLEVAAGTL